MMLSGLSVATQMVSVDIKDSGSGVAVYNRCLGDKV